MKGKNTINCTGRYT